jgi:hypothetical protein
VYTGSHTVIVWLPFLRLKWAFQREKGSLKKYDNGVELLLYSFRMMFEGV